MPSAKLLGPRRTARAPRSRKPVVAHLGRRRHAAYEADELGREDLDRLLLEAARMRANRSLSDG